MSKWIKRWEVPSESNSSKFYIVAQDTEGGYGCDCPVWKFRREECKHIERVKREHPKESVLQEYREPSIVLANVKEVTPMPENQLYVPLITLDGIGTHFSATLVYDLMRHGVAWRTCQQRYSIAKRNSKKAIVSYIQAHGRCIYRDIDPGRQASYTIVPLEGETA